MQNGTHLIIEDYSSGWAPHYCISLKNGTRLFCLAPYEIEKGIIADYAYVNRTYTKEIYSLNEIFRRLPIGYSTYIFEIYTHNRQYDFILDGESSRILFGDYSPVVYLPSISISLGNTIYDIVFKHFNEAVFQQIRECVFGDVDQNDALNKVWRLVEWADLNTEYQRKALPYYIYDPLTFMERKRGICIDYAVFYAAGLFTIGFDEAYVLTFDASRGGHAVAGTGINQSMLVLEQNLPIVELQDYIEFSKIILDASVHMSIYAYKIEHMDGDFVIEFFELDPSKYRDANPLDGLTDNLSRILSRVYHKNLEQA